MESTALTTKPVSLTTNPDEWAMIKEQAKLAFASGLLPKSITKPEQAAIIALKGRELGIPIMHALSSISVINGKPTLSSELMLALIHNRVRGSRISFLTPPEKAHLECEVEVQRPGGLPQKFSFTMEDAKRAGLSTNHTYKKFPAAMLRARVISAMARAVFPDAIMGCYTPEELGGPAEVEEEFPVAQSKVEHHEEAEQMTFAPVSTITPQPSNRINERFREVKPTT